MKLQNAKLRAERLKRDTLEQKRIEMLREERLRQDTIEMKRNELVQDSLHAQQVLSDSLELDSFLLKNPMPIVLDTTELALLADTLHNDPTPQKVMGITFAKPLPLTKAAKQEKVRKQTLKVARLKVQQNELKDEVKSGQTQKRPTLQANIQELNLEQKKLKRLQKPSIFVRIGRALAWPFKKKSKPALEQ